MLDVYDTCIKPTTCSNTDFHENAIASHVTETFQRVHCCLANLKNKVPVLCNQ